MTFISLLLHLINNIFAFVFPYFGFFYSVVSLAYSIWIIFSFILHISRQLLIDSLPFLMLSYSLPSPTRLFLSLLFSFTFASAFKLLARHFCSWWRKNEIFWNAFCFLFFIVFPSTVLEFTRKYVTFVWNECVLTSWIYVITFVLFSFFKTSIKVFATFVLK